MAINAVVTICLRHDISRLRFEEMSISATTLDLDADGEAAVRPVFGVRWSNFCCAKDGQVLLCKLDQCGVGVLLRHGTTPQGPRTTDHGPQTARPRIKSAKCNQTNQTACDEAVRVRVKDSV